MATDLTLFEDIESSFVWIVQLIKKVQIYLKYQSLFSLIVGPFKNCENIKVYVYGPAYF